MFSNRKIVLITILLITVSIAAYVLLVVIPSQLAEKSYKGAKQIGRDISEVFQVTPEITINKTIVLQQQAPILELATLTQKFQHQYEWINTTLKSTKKIKITGTFDAKAGFDLNQKFSIRIEENKAYITLPKPQLLSIESLGDVKFEDENGYWNWIDEDDRSQAINAFIKDARQYAATAGFVNQSQQIMEEKLREILALHGKEVVIQYSETITIDAVK